MTVWNLNQKTARIAVLSEAERGRIISMDGNTLETMEVIDTIDNSDAFLHAAHFYAEGEAEGFHVALQCSRSTRGKLQFAYAVYHGNAAQPPLQCMATLPVAEFDIEDAAAQLDEHRISYVHTLAVTPHYVILFASARRLDYSKWLNQFSDKGEVAGES